MLFQALDELTHLWQTKGSIGIGWYDALRRRRQIAPFPPAETGVANAVRERSAKAIMFWLDTTLFTRPLPLQKPLV